MKAMQIIGKIRTTLFRGCKVYICLKPQSRRNLNEKLRTANAKYYLQQHSAIIRIPIKILTLLFWPFNSFFNVRKYHSKFAHAINREYGTGKVRQFFAQLYLAWFEFIPCRYYYQFHLFEPMRMRHRDAYLFQRNNHALFTALNGFHSSDVINDKEKFSRFCHVNSIPSPRALAFINKGKVSFKEETKTWQDIVIKPVSGNMGRGVKFAQSANGFFQYDGETLTTDQFLQQIAGESQEEPLLIQERLYSHPQLRALSNDYLASIRMVTFLDDSGTPVYLAALLLLPHDAITISNEGRTYPINAETGEILPPSLLPPLAKNRNKIIEECRQVTGHRLPYWDKAKQLALDAHQLLPEYFSLGWDIAITSDGPVILETNIGWDTDLIQYYHDLPLLDNEFARCAATRLDRLNT